MHGWSLVISQTRRRLGSGLPLAGVNAPTTSIRGRCRPRRRLVVARARDLTDAVPIAAHHVPNIHPWNAIIQTAKEQGCDLILMASHGRRGIAGVLLGSETKKVLTHTSIPVLVWRGA